MTSTIKYTSKGLHKSDSRLIEKYWEFCDRQPVALWFILPVFILPCVIFTIGFFIQYINNQPEVWYFVVSGICLYANILPNFANANTRVTITIFIVTLLLHFILWRFLIF